MAVPFLASWFVRRIGSFKPREERARPSEWWRKQQGELVPSPERAAAAYVKYIGTDTRLSKVGCRNARLARVTGSHYQARRNAPAFSRGTNGAASGCLFLV